MGTRQRRTHLYDTLTQHSEFSGLARSSVRKFATENTPEVVEEYAARNTPLNYGLQKAVRQIVRARRNL